MNTRVSIRAGVGVASGAIVVFAAHAQPGVPATSQFSLSDFYSWIGNVALHDDESAQQRGAAIRPGGIK